MSDHRDWENDEDNAPYLVTQYTFNPHALTLTFTALTVVDPHRVLAVYDTSIKYDVTTGAGPFEFGLPIYLAGGNASAAGNVLTLPVGSIPGAARASDSLRIHYSVAPPPGMHLVRLINKAAFPATGAPNFLYLAMDTGQLWEWTGTAYSAI